MKHLSAKRLIPAMLAALMLAALIVPAGAAEQTEAARSFITLRAPYGEEDIDWRDSVVARWDDTGEIIALSNRFGANVFATVLEGDAGRTFSSDMIESVRFADDEAIPFTYPVDMLSARGVVRGVGGDRFDGTRAVTMAEAVTLLARLLGIAPEPSAGEAWYAPAYDACARYGIISAEGFDPDAVVSRERFTVMCANAFTMVGWLEQKNDQHDLTNVVDAGDISEYARASYHALLNKSGAMIGLYDWMSDGELMECRPREPVTRQKAVELLWDIVRYLPVYPSEEAIELGFDEGMPVIDGSTSTYPFTSVVYNRFFNNARRHPDFVAQHSKSHESYERLINGEADVLFASIFPTSDIEALAKSKGVELELIPIAFDAQIFFTNVDNPATGLTMQQITDIYVDNAYENWKAVGGPDAGLVPYCRNADSGSHANMERYFLHGKDINEAIKSETTSVAMQSILTDVADVPNTVSGAFGLGYSIYYYFDVTQDIIFGEERLKLLAIDGVYPTDDTIADGTYPLSDNAYVVLRADEPEDSPARRLAEFMLTPAGQECVGAAGYGAITTFE